MKKILFFTLLFCCFILPFKANATEFYDVVYHKDSTLTEEQKQTYINSILADSKFIENSKQYKYYMIVYQEKGSYPFLMNYKNVVDVMFFDDLSVFESNIPTRFEVNIRSVSSTYYYYFNDSSLSVVNGNLLPFYLFTFVHQEKDSNDNYKSTYYFNADYVLSTNVSYSLNIDLNVLDSDNNIMYTIKAGDNVFASKQIIVDKKYNFSDIEKADNTLYKLSKELLGDLPEEFVFLYALLQLFLGIVIILIVLSPILVLLRLLK